MIVNMCLGLRDVPGNLIRALDPISSHGGNIISVLHSREKKDLVEVNITFEIKDESYLNLIKKEIKKTKIRIHEITVEGRRYHSKKKLDVVLIGHVIDNDIRDTVDRINAVGLVSDLGVTMPSPEEKSSVIMSIDVDGKKMSKLMTIVDKISKEKDFLAVKSLIE